MGPSISIFVDDPLMELRKLLKMHGFEGGKKYFWSVATAAKTFLLVYRVGCIFVYADSPQRVADLTATLPVVMTAVLKMIHLYFDQQRVEYFYDSVTYQFWDYKIAGHDIEVEAKSAFTFTKLIIGFHGPVSCFSMVLFLLFPVAEMPSEDDRILPNVLWTPFDKNATPVFEIIFCILLINGVLSYIGNVAYDFLYLYSLQHLYVQFMILKGLLIHITDGVMVDFSDVDKFNSVYFQKTVMARLKICAEHHSRLLKYGNEIGGFCSAVLVPQLVLTYASLVVNGFTLLSGDCDITKSIILFLLSLSTFMQFALIALPASQLYSQSLTVLDAIYDSKWYLFNAAMKRACTYMMMNGQEGIVIKAGGVTKIDNPLLVDMMQKVFSAITLLQALIEGNAAE